MEKLIFIRPSEIATCWETNDACIVEMKDGKKWVCKKYIIDQECKEWRTIIYINSHINDTKFLQLQLAQEKRGGNNG